MITWHAYDLRTNTALAELPLRARCGDVLNGVGMFEATLQLPAGSPAAVRALLDATTPERTIVYASRDGRMLGGWIIWTRTRGSAGTVQLRGASVLSFLRRNRLVATLGWNADPTYGRWGGTWASPDDQFTIARALINALQVQPGGNILIDTTDATLSGVVRERIYWAHERKNVGDALVELSAVENGFDFAFACAWVAGAPKITLRLGYPRLGRLAADNQVVIESGKNLLSWSIDEDGSRSARSVDAVGAGDGPNMLVTTSTRSEWIAAGWPLTADMVSHKTVTDMATLAAHAAAASAERAATPQWLQVTVAPDDPDGGLGAWTLGDFARVSITDTAMPDPFTANVRIIGWQLTAGDTDELALTLAQVP